MAVSPYRQRPSPKSAGAVVNAFESATAEVIARRTSFLERSTLYTLGGFILALILFISLFQLDRLVSAIGKTVPIEGTLYVQPLDKAIIRSIDVRVGDIVKKGQVLATLDPTFAAADLSELQQKVASLEAETRRIKSEEANKPFVATDASPYEKVQETIWRQRQQEYAAGLKDLDERIHGDEVGLVKLQQDIKQYSERAVIATEIEKMRHDMELKGWESRLVSLGARDTRIDIERLRDESQNSFTITQHDLASLKAQRDVYVSTWHSNNLADLVLKQNDLDSSQQELEKAQKLRDLVDLVAPEDAIVTKVEDMSAIGSVASEAQALFTLVPLDAPLEVDIQIETQDIGFPQVGDRVSLKFDAYKFLEHGEGEGRVKTISQNSFTINPDGTPATTPYFDARVEITSVNLHDVPADFRLIPGMTLQADIVVGRRTIFWYIFGSALRTGSEAMHEP